MPCDGGHIDDHPASACGHTRTRKLLRTDQRAFQVDAHDPLVTIVGHVEHAFENIGSRAVDQHIARPRLGHCPPCLIGIGQVGDETTPSGFGTQAVEVRLRSAYCHDFSTPLCEQLRGRTTDPLARSSDDDGFSRKLHWPLSHNWDGPITAQISVTIARRLSVMN